MNRIITFLQKHKTLNIALALVYFVLIVLLHDVVGKQFGKLDDAVGRARYNQIITNVGLAIFGIYMLYLAIQLIKGKQLFYKLFYLITTLLLIYLSFEILMVVKMEIIHFLMYLFLAVIMFPLIGRFGETIFWVTVLGALDEAYQYIILYPLRADYFDFNDVVINLLGAALGVILLWISGVIATKPIYKPWYKSMPVKFCLVVVGIGLVLFATGTLSFYPDNSESSPLLFSRELSHGFWKTVPGPTWVTFHVMQPIEGLISLFYLFSFYLMMDYVNAGSKDLTKASN